LARAASGLLPPGGEGDSEETPDSSYLRVERRDPSVKAVILCGGQGTRIRDANELLPKPMLPIGGKPIVWHIMKMYARHGVREFVLCLGYKGWAIKEFFLNYKAMTADLAVTLGKHGAVEVLGRTDEEDWKVTLAETGEATMTGGRVAAVRRYVEGDEPFLLTYGDGVSDVDISATLAFHRKHGKVATVTAVRPPGRFGEMVIEAGQVREFNEKPQATEGFINGGFFVLDGRRTWDFIDGDPRTLFEHGPLRGLASAGQLAAYPHTGFWQPMDTLREYQLLNDLWAGGKAPWKTW
jgi:glucose-1-phosphate cytidylyltransferase